MNFSFPENIVQKSIFWIRAQESDFYYAAPSKNVYIDSVRVFLKNFLAFVCMCVFVPSLVSSMSTKRQTTATKTW